MIRVETTAGILRQIFRPVNAISESCKVHFDSDGIRIPGADQLNLAAVDVEVEKEAFEHYEADGAIIGVHFEKLMEILGKVDSSDSAFLAFNPEKRLLELNVGYKQFVLGLVQLDAVPTQPHIPEVVHPVKFEIPQIALADAIDTADVFADKVTLDVSNSEDYVMVRAEGDIDRTKLKFKQGQELSSLETGNIQNSFSLSLLDDAVSVIPSEKNIRVKLAHDRPIVLSYTGINDSMNVTFTLAPWKEAT